MAGLILKKIKAALSSQKTRVHDARDLTDFYSAADELVNRHFDCALREDFEALMEHQAGVDEDWSW